MSMRKGIWILQSVIVVVMVEYYLGVQAMMQEKAEASIPMTTFSPPEGNTTFLDGTNWCVALAGVPQVDLQNALDWACGLGMADCGPIQSGGACFEPDTLLSHASYAFNYYYQQNGNSDIACNFGGTATLTKSNPRVMGSVFMPHQISCNRSVGSSAPSMLKYKKPSLNWWKVTTTAILLLLYY
ncbi:unnamed protein product [Camellia sinensis]